MWETMTKIKTPPPHSLFPMLNFSSSLPTPFCSVPHRYRMGWEMRSYCQPIMLPLCCSFPSHVSHGLQKLQWKICSTVVFTVDICGVFTALEHEGTFFPSSFSELCAHRPISHLFFSYSSVLYGVLSFHKYVFIKVLPALLIDNGMSCTGSIFKPARTCCFQHKAASCPPQRPPLQHLHTIQFVTSRAQMKNILNIEMSFW